MRFFSICLCMKTHGIFRVSTFLPKFLSKGVLTGLSCCMSTQLHFFYSFSVRHCCYLWWETNEPLGLISWFLRNFVFCFIFLANLTFICDLIGMEIHFFRHLVTLFRLSSFAVICFWLSFHLIEEKPDHFRTLQNPVSLPARPDPFPSLDDFC